MKTGFRDTGLTASWEVVGAVETESGRGALWGPVHAGSLLAHTSLLGEAESNEASNCDM